MPHLLVELNVLQDFDGLVIITKQGVKPQEPHQAEVTQHLVQGVAPIFSGHTLWVSCNTPTNNMLAALYNTYSEYTEVYRLKLLSYQKSNKLLKPQFYRVINLQRT